MPLSASNFMVEFEFKVCLLHPDYPAASHPLIPPPSHSDDLMPLLIDIRDTVLICQVDGKAHNIFGDGFAVWLAKDRAKSGPVFGSVGELFLLLETGVPS